VCAWVPDLSRALDQVHCRLLGICRQSISQIADTYCFGGGVVRDDATYRELNVEIKEEKIERQHT
jgi:hypothetical protein